jgi:DmsE family decaheme c-type cytochrome
MGKRVLVLLATSVGLALSVGFAHLAGPSAPAQGFAGMDACISCHEDTVKSVKATAHGASAASCESCHGNAKEHIAAGGDPSKMRSYKKLSAKEASATCQTCHSNAGQAHFAGSAHDNRDVSCVTCHNPHPKGKPAKGLLSKPQFELCTTCHLQKKAALMRSGHMPMREGKMNCTSCHNPHGNTNDKQLLQSSVNANCYSCHAEKRGPFLFEHAPVRENCLNCHDAHGSIHDNLLKVKQPVLCQQCHIGTRHPGQIHVNDRYSYAQGCLNCHPTVHGSTHPTGNRFWR